MEESAAFAREIRQGRQELISKLAAKNAKNAEGAKKDEETTPRTPSQCIKKWIVIPSGLAWNRRKDTSIFRKHAPG